MFSHTLWYQLRFLEQRENRSRKYDYRYTAIFVLTHRQGPVVFLWQTGDKFSIWKYFCACTTPPHLFVLDKILDRISPIFRPRQPTNQRYCRWRHECNVIPYGRTCYTNVTHNLLSRILQFAKLQFKVNHGECLGQLQLTAPRSRICPRSICESSV